MTMLPICSISSEMRYFRELHIVQILPNDVPSVTFGNIPVPEEVMSGQSSKDIYDCTDGHRLAVSSDQRDVIHMVKLNIDSVFLEGSPNQDAV